MVEEKNYCGWLNFCYFHTLYFSRGKNFYARFWRGIFAA